MESKIQRNSNDITNLKKDKVDKKEGYDLSKNDYTDEEKQKLDEIEEKAQVNKVESLSVNGTKKPIDDNKNINIEVPTKTSDITNDSDFTTNAKLNETKTNLDSKINKNIQDISNANNQIETNKQGIENNKNSIDAINTEQANQNSAIQKNKLDIETLNTDTQNNKETIRTVQEDLKNYYRKSETYSQEEVNNLVSAIPKFKITVVEQLPTTDISASTIYLIPSQSEESDIFQEWIYVNNKWEKLGVQKTDLSNYYTKSEIDDKLKNKADKTQLDDYVKNTDYNQKINEIEANKVGNTEFSQYKTATDQSITDINNHLTEKEKNISTNTTNIEQNTKDIKKLNDYISTECNDFEKIDDFLKNFFAMTTSDEHFGIEWYPFETSNSSLCEKLYDNTKYSINPATDTEEEVNTYPFQFKTWDCNAFVDDDKVIHITAIEGNSNFGNTEDTIKDVIYKEKTYTPDVFTINRTRYEKYEKNSKGKFEYDFYWNPHEGYTPIDISIRKDGTVSPYYLLPKYVAGIDSQGRLRSIKGLRPAHYLGGTTTGTEDISYNVSYTGSVTLFHNRGKYYSAGLMSEYKAILSDFWLKFGTRNTQSIMVGNTSNNYQYQVSIAEENVNRVVLTISQANNIDLYSCVSIGDRGTSTNNDRNNKYMHNIVNDVRVIGKETVDDGHIALILDHAPFTTTETTWVSTMHEVSGYSDLVKGRYGSPISNTNGKHGMVFNGVEIAVGGYEVAGNAIIDIEGNSRNFYVTKDTSQLSTNVTTIKSTYKKSDLSIEPASLNGWKYITEMQADLKNGLLVPTKCGESGSGTGTGFADGCYIDNSTSGQRECLLLGLLNNFGAAGLSCLGTDFGISNGHWFILARHSINGVGGELANS